MIKRFYELQEKVLAYYPDANSELLKKAYAVATDAHMNQRRASNEPYIIHPLAVTSILADMKLDEISIAAGLLHDVLEDSPYSREDLDRMFGREISDIVWGVTKISKISDVDVEDAQAETLKKMIIAMTTDVRVILIKLADRLHNIRTLRPLRPEKRVRIARETLEIYAPIAYRLGMGKIRDELEDTSFEYLYPQEFRRIKAEVSDRANWATLQLENLKREIETMLAGYRIPAEIHYRIKRPISIYRKQQRQNIELEQVFDLMALRIITDTVANCYAIMGMIHQRWTHIPSRWRDFITNPKSNYYQSIHTTIITREAVKFEIQIRTREMHQNAEEGISAHWKYKEGLSFIENDNRLQWFRDMIEYHKANPDPKEFLSLVKKDLTPNEIYVFTPKGKVINLKAGSTPIDFAYAIHSEIGDHCKSAVVNEKLTPLRTRLNSGDVVEIVTAKASWPSSDWLKFVVTPRAKRKILGFLQKKESALLVERGRRIWQVVRREYQKKFKVKVGDEELGERLRKHHYSDLDSFFRDIGSGKKAIDRNILTDLFPDLKTIEIQPQRPRRRPAPRNRLVEVEGQSDIAFTFARCCSPIKGDEIIGYLTRNRGLVIHKKSCANVNLDLEPRIRTVNWIREEEHAFTVRYELIVEDRPGMLSLVTGIPAKYGSNIKKIEQTQFTQNQARLRITFQVRDSAQLEQIAADFGTIDGLLSVQRKKTA